MSMSPLMRRAIERLEETGICMDQSMIWRAYGGNPVDIAGVSANAVEEIMRLRAGIRSIISETRGWAIVDGDGVADDLEALL